MIRRLFVSALALVLAVGTSLAADVKSGPQVDQKLPGPFHPLNVNGAQAGKKHCLYCENGEKPVAMIFAREVTPSLKKLIKEIDGAAAKSDGKMGSFVVFLGETETLEKQLKDVAKETGLKSCVLAIDNPAGPEKYNVAKDADVTVVFYVDRTVKANFAFGKGEMKDKDVATIVSSLSKIQGK